MARPGQHIGGRIRAILIHPTNASTQWVAVVSGGSWKTTNNAASFFPCDDWMANLAICCTALDQADPNVLYAGTGELSFAGVGVRGAGILKSTNASYATQDEINRLAVCPTNHLRLFISGAALRIFEIEPRAKVV